MPKKPIALNSPAFKKLQRKWYKKLQREGFEDVERFMDMNQLPVSTMPRQHGSFLYDPETGELSDEAEIVPLADTDKAGYWREVGRKQSLMRRSDKDYKLIATFADAGSMAAAARACNLSRSEAENRIKAWLRLHDLKECTGLSRAKPEPKSEPLPCRSLSKDEIAKLNLKPPRG
jgi:hypothetical protein